MAVVLLTGNRERAPGGLGGFGEPARFGISRSQRVQYRRLLASSQFGGALGELDGFAAIAKAGVGIRSQH
ncbi:MAG: hypothetical protein WAJ87_16910, partial [Bryobacteraceae bacterium]